MDPSKEWTLERLNHRLVLVDVPIDGDLKPIQESDIKGILQKEKDYWWLVVIHPRKLSWWERLRGITAHTPFRVRLERRMGQENGSPIELFQTGSDMMSDICTRVSIHRARFRRNIEGVGEAWQLAVVMIARIKNGKIDWVHDYCVFARSERKKKWQSDVGIE